MGVRLCEPAARGPHLWTRLTHYPSTATLADIARSAESVVEVDGAPRELHQHDLLVNQTER